MLSVAGNGALQNVLVTLETQRTKIAATQKKGYLFIAIGIIVAVAGFASGLPVPSIIIGLILIIYGGSLLYRISDELKSYQEAFKVQVIGTALKSLDDSLVIEPYKGILVNEFEATQIFSETPDRYKTEDLVQGKADKTAFYFAEVHAEYKTEVQTKNGTQNNGFLYALFRYYGCLSGSGHYGRSFQRT